MALRLVRQQSFPFHDGPAVETYTRRSRGEAFVRIPPPPPPPPRVARTIVLVSCSSTKATADASREMPARYLYASPLFRMALDYAEQLAPDGARVLSARYGLIEPDRRIVFYDESVTRMRLADRARWGVSVASRIGQDFGAGDHRIVVLAGRDYLDPIRAAGDAAWTFEAPLESLQIGQRLAWFKARRERNEET